MWSNFGGAIAERDGYEPVSDEIQPVLYAADAFVAPEPDRTRADYIRGWIARNEAGGSDFSWLKDDGGYHDAMIAGSTAETGDFSWGEVAAVYGTPAPNVVREDAGDYPISDSGPGWLGTLRRLSLVPVVIAETNVGMPGQSDVTDKTRMDYIREYVARNEAGGSDFSWVTGSYAADSSAYAGTAEPIGAFTYGELVTVLNQRPASVRQIEATVSTLPVVTHPTPELTNIRTLVQSVTGTVQRLGTSSAETTPAQKAEDKRNYVIIGGVAVAIALAVWAYRA